MKLAIIGLKYTFHNKAIINTLHLRRLLRDFIAYHKISNIRRAEFQNINVLRLVLELYLPNPLMSGVKSRMKK